MDQKALKHIAATRAEEYKAHLVDLTTHQHRHNLMIEVYVDTDSGISTGELALLNKVLVKDFDAFFEGEQSFSLTVSSPGLDRPLEHAWQYNRHKGRRIVITAGDEAAPRTIEGTLLGIEDGIVSVQEHDGVHAIGFAEILKAVMNVAPQPANVKK
jgi:ribosome maturation factor RimP